MKCHINQCVYDGTWEASEAFELDRNELVDAWVKNDHLGFEVVYIFDGCKRQSNTVALGRAKNVALEMRN